MKPLSLNCVLFKKESFVFGIANGDIYIEYSSKKIELVNLNKEFSNLFCDKWQHIAISYRKSIEKIKIVATSKIIINIF